MLGGTKQNVRVADVTVFSNQGVDYISYLYIYLNHCKKTQVQVVSIAVPRPPLFVNLAVVGYHDQQQSGAAMEASYEAMK